MPVQLARYMVVMLSYLEGDDRLKPATSVKVRHILCEKQSKALEALQLIRQGVSFATVSAHLL